MAVCLRRGVGRPGSGGPGAEPSPPALWFQCLEAAAACTSLTWAAVKRPPGAPHHCRCRPWAASFWRWLAEPSTCPAGTCGLLGGPGEPAQPTSGVSTVPMVPDPSVLSSSLCDRLCYPRAGRESCSQGPGGRGGCQTQPRGPRHGPCLARGPPPPTLQPGSSPQAQWSPSSPPGPPPLSLAPPGPQGAQAYCTAAGDPGHRQLPNHHDCPCVRCASPPRRDAQHRAAGCPYPPPTQEEGQGWFRFLGPCLHGGGAGAPPAPEEAGSVPMVAPRRTRVAHVGGCGGLVSVHPAPGRCVARAAYRTTVACTLPGLVLQGTPWDPHWVWRMELGCPGARALGLNPGFAVDAVCA